MLPASRERERRVGVSFVLAESSEHGLSHLFEVVIGMVENRFNKKNDVLFPYHLFMKDSVREFFMKICCTYEFRFLLTLLCIFYKHPYAFCALPDIEGRSLAAALIAADEYLWMCQKDCLCTLPH
jgi:hypothetical protein